MVRDRSGARYATTRRLAALSLAACVALAGCGIKGPLKRVDATATPPAAAATPPAPAPTPAPPAAAAPTAPESLPSKPRLP